MLHIASHYYNDGHNSSYICACVCVFACVCMGGGEYLCGCVAHRLMYAYVCVLAYMCAYIMCVYISLQCMSHANHAIDLVYLL